MASTIKSVKSHTEPNYSCFPHPLQLSLQIWGRNFGFICWTTQEKKIIEK